MIERDVIDWRLTLRTDIHVPPCEVSYIPRRLLSRDKWQFLVTVYHENTATGEVFERPYLADAYGNVLNQDFKIVNRRECSTDPGAVAEDMADQINYGGQFMWSGRQCRVAAEIIEAYLRKLGLSDANDS